MSDDWGPFVPEIDRTERIARLRALQAICNGLARQHCELIIALGEAETDHAMLHVASAEFDRLPAIAKRKLWAA
jgi:hypothetical protein